MPNTPRPYSSMASVAGDMLYVIFYHVVICAVLFGPVYFSHRLGIQHAEIERQSAARYERALVLADTDGDKKTTFGEQVEAWRRMGYNKHFTESEGGEQFPRPSEGHLNKLEQNRK